MNQSAVVEKSAVVALAALTERGVLRFITAGSVDDGKSTLIGRLLHDTHAIMEDQFAAVKRASVKRGALETDLSLFTDGLEAEREQGITIDVAYRYFTTPRRKFIIADTPGHEQYTRNMVTGASTADAAIILLDARKGLLAQSKRHTLLANLLGIRHIIVAVNKMDAVEYGQSVFESVKADFERFAAPLAIPHVTFIPVSALRGDSVVEHGTHMAWYTGPTLLHVLENTPSGSQVEHQAFRFPVQRVSHGTGARGYAGRIAAGQVATGDEIVALPSGRRTIVRSIAAPDGERAVATAGDTVTMTLADEIDISRGDMLVSAAHPPRTLRDAAATLCWLTQEPLRVGARYVLRHTTRTLKAHITAVQAHLDVHTLEQQTRTGEVTLNDIVHVTLALQQPLFADAYVITRTLGAFILIDEVTNQTVAAGMIGRAKSDRRKEPDRREPDRREGQG
jgi:sulfate adenylyltransferase subunit 1